jgi:hypothetical protein
MLLSTLYAKGTRSQDSIDEAGVICAQAKVAIVASASMQSIADARQTVV